MPDKKQYKFFKALGNETRYNILSELVKRERCACELPGIVGRAQPTISLQLKYLTKEGIVSNRREGKKIIYKISDKRVIRLFSGKLN